MSKENIIFIIVASLILVFMIAEGFIQKSIESKLTSYLYSKNYEAYEKLHNKFITKYLFNPFNLKFIDLNKYGMQSDIENFEKTLKEFDQMRLNKKQKQAIYTKAFFYYVMKKQKEEATRYYHLLKDLDKPEIMPNIELFFDTFINGGHKYLEDVHKLLANAADIEKADYESILAQMYDNMGNKKEASKYSKLAEKHFSEMEESLSKRNNK